MREKASTVNYRHSDDREREHVTGLHHEGLDDIMSNQENVRKVLEDVFREIDIYRNDITLLQNRFVSPLSPIAADFYKFYLSDTVVVAGDSCVVLSFVPHTPQTWGFLGKLYVPKSDSTMMVKKLELYLPHSINVNFVDAMTLTQTFDRAPDGSRLKTSDDMSMELSILPGMPGLYVRRNTTYSRFNFDAPADEDLAFGHAEYQIVADDAYSQDNDFWSTHRNVPLARSEKSLATMVERMRRVPLYYWTERTLRLLVSGYVHTGKPSKFDYGPVNTSISYNTVEGIRLRTGGMTTAALSPRWFTRGYVAYGLRDHKWKYRGEVEYSFHDKKLHSREFPVHSLRFTSLYDIDQLGQRYVYTNADNLF
ncbi:MAG: carboxypeptidase-like regulatory domain-containing protein, partial [Muribaculum intestinale]|nr:carboxypeptidase-like regulatory domain-containing protein [Muribaculum intestinale]